MSVQQDAISECGHLEGCAKHGHAKEALKHSEQKSEEGVQPDEKKFLCLVSACR